MAIVVTPSNPLKVTVSTGAKRVVTTATTQSSLATTATIDNLSGVDLTDKQDGYTLVYDSASGNWTAQTVSAVSITSIDGGTF